MTDATPETPGPTASQHGSLREFLTTLPRWKKIAVATGLALLVIGLVCALFEATPESAGVAPSAAEPGGATVAPSTLVPGGPGGTTPGQPEAEVPEEGSSWSRSFINFGFSFFVGFAVGYALRAFLRLALVFAGILVLAMLGLEHVGFLDVHWQKMDDAFEHLVGNLTERTDAFRLFVTSSLPNAGLAGLGLFAGFKKNR